MRTTHAWFWTVIVGAALAGLSGCSMLSERTSTTSAADAAAHGSAPAAARGGVWVQVKPNTISPGFSVQVRADCGDNTNSATVTSKAFGTITVQPWNSLLFAEVTIPASTKPGRFDVTVTCRTGSTATTSLTIVAAATATAPATRGPNTGGGYLARHGSTGSGWSALTSGPAGWFGIGMLALVAAAAIGLRSRRTSRAPAPPDQPVPAESKRRETTH